jgi:hypothetical protein
MPINGVALTAVGAGVVFVWSGVKGWSVLGTVKDLVTGVQPSGTNQYPLSGGNASGGSGGVTGVGLSGIAQDALKYQGHPYLFGGAPGKSGSNAWDCSSCVNWIVGHDAGQAIPGMAAGSYDGSVHGPTTFQWAVWPGLHSVPRAQLAPGDIIVWIDHMGIYVGNDKVLSALNPGLGTMVTTVESAHPAPIIKMGRLG